MPETVHFRSRIEAARAGTATGGGAAAKIPDELVKPLGGLKQMRMDAKLNGIAFKTSTMPYRGGFYVGVHKAVREQAGVVFGDEVDIELTRDESPRTFEMAPELDAALATEPGLRARFDALSYTNRKEMSESIRTAVKPETRAARLEKAVAQLRGA
jgi:Bacteriocin-protection, YdeI or OmpD-Associated/Domain of unknown function (DUF1905)